MCTSRVAAAQVTDERGVNVCSVYTLKFQPALKKSETMVSGGERMHLETVVL